MVGTEPFKLHLLLEAIPGDVRLDGLHHVLHRLPDKILVNLIGQREDRVAHDHRRFSRIEDDNRASAARSADDLNRFGRGPGKFVDISAGSRPGRAR